jgi:hypothetical protein
MYEFIPEGAVPNKDRNRDLVKALVPVAQRLGSIFAADGITASNVRRRAISLGLITETTPTHFLSTVMRLSGLESNGETRVSTIPSAKGRRQLVYYPAETPYSG